jgi:hypothetical protein
VYSLAKFYLNLDDKEEPHELDVEEYDLATHVMHRSSKTAVALKEFGVAEVNATWSIADNGDEQTAALSDGVGLKVGIWHGMRGHPYFDAKRHREEHSPEMASCSGGRAGTEASKREAEADEAPHEAEAKAELAGTASGAAVGITPPSKKRRSVT